MGKAIVEVESGICGFITKVVAQTDADGMLVRLAIDSQCGNIKGLARELMEVDPMSILMGKAKDDPVFMAAANHPVHHACPVPVGIIKAVEVAAGLALPREARIRVERGEE
ncbi:MAG: hypothetical protein M0Z94_16705 [Dehalococcoidales bacterium]|nr:hypothetical protein [Dehalococcoidales bacterium]